MAEFKGEVYVGKDGDWRWRIVASNGRIVADSAEGYEDRADCLSMYAQLHSKVPVEFVDSSAPDD